MKRGDLVVAVLPGDYGKPRPVLIVQADIFSALNSIIVCPLTSDAAQPGLLRVALAPDPTNGLLKPSLVMVEKINALSRSRCRDRIGRIDPEAMGQVDQAIRLILGQHADG